MYKCLQCGNFFLDNDDGVAENGLSRPRCPECLEEVDIELAPDFEDDDADGYDEYDGHTDEIDDLIDEEEEDSE